MKKATSAGLLCLTCAGSVVVMEKVPLSAGAVKSADIIVAKMVARLLPVYLGGALVDVCQTAEGDVKRAPCTARCFLFFFK